MRLEVGSGTALRRIEGLRFYLGVDTGNGFGGDEGVDESARRINFLVQIHVREKGHVYESHIGLVGDGLREPSSGIDQNHFFEHVGFEGVVVEGEKLAFAAVGLWVNVAAVDV